MAVRLRALQSFAGLEGRVRRGTVFTAGEARAAYLTQKRLAERLDPPGPSEVQATGPSQNQAVLPEEVKELGGGWYEWNGQRFRGRAAAEAARGA